MSERISPELAAAAKAEIAAGVGKPGHGFGIGPHEWNELCRIVESLAERVDALERQLTAEQ